MPLFTYIWTRCHQEKKKNTILVLHFLNNIPISNPGKCNTTNERSVYTLIHLKKRTEENILSSRARLAESTRSCLSHPKNVENWEIFKVSHTMILRSRKQATHIANKADATNENFSIQLKNWERATLLGHCIKCCDYSSVHKPQRYYNRTTLLCSADRKSVV